MFDGYFGGAIGEPWQQKRSCGGIDSQLLTVWKHQKIAFVTCTATAAAGSVFQTKNSKTYMEQGRAIKTVRCTGKPVEEMPKKRHDDIYIHIYLQADPQRVRTRWSQVKSFVPKNLSEKVLADVKVGQAAHSPCSEPNMQARVLAIVFIAQH